MKLLLQKILTTLAHLYLRRYKPEIIAVTGNVGKTSAKEAIVCVLSAHKKVRASGGNLNNEFGVPLTIIGDFSNAYYSRGGTPFFWFRVLMKGVFGLLEWTSEYPGILV